MPGLPPPGDDGARRRAQPRLRPATGRPTRSCCTSSTPTARWRPTSSSTPSRSKDGRVVTGLIESETATSLTLKRAEGATDTILRRDVEQVTTTGQSLMPEGLESRITPREMADLIGFLLGSMTER